MQRIAFCLASAVLVLATAPTRADEATPAEPETKPAPVCEPSMGAITVMPEAFTSFGAAELGGYLFTIIADPDGREIILQA